MAKGAHREKSKFGGGFEPLTLGEVVCVAKPTAELVTLTEWDLRAVFKGVRRDLLAHRAGLYIADLLHHAILDGDPHPALFDASIRALHSLDDPAQAHATLARFQWRLLTEIGYRPRIGVEASAVRAASTYLFRPQAGGFAEEGTGDGWRVRGETVRALTALDGESAAAPARVAERAGRLLSEYLRYVLARDLHTRAVVYGASPPAAREAARDPNRV